MSTISVANIQLEVTGTNRIYYTGNNVIRTAANGLQMPIGPTSGRPTGEQGLIRYNSDLGTFEAYNASSWGAVSITDLTPANSWSNTVGASGNAYTNVVYGYVNTSMGLANQAGVIANASFGLTNTTYTAVNSAFGVINAAFTRSNTLATSANAYASVVGTSANAYSDATFIKLTAASQTITGNLSITGNLTLLGGSTIITTNTLSIGDSLIYLAANNYSGTDIVDIGFIANYGNATGANVHTGLYREHTNKEYYLFQGYDAEPINNHIGALSNNMTLSVLNTDVRTSNLNLGGANAIIWITSGFGVANAAFGVANGKVSSVTGTAGQIFVNSANTIAPTINLISTGVTATTYGGATQIPVIAVDAFGRLTSAANVAVSGMDYPYVNTSTTAANNYAGAMANSGNTWTTATFATITNAAAAFAAANARVSSVSGTSGRITSSGGTTPAIDLASGVVTPTSATGGISALTVDTYGRVTAVTGSAGYVTSSGVTSVANGAGLNGGTITTTGTLSLQPSGVTLGTYSSGISAITVDTYGRITSITGSAGYVTSSGVTSVSGTAARITSSGGTTPVIDLATAGPGAGSYSSGISALTLDAYGRVTAVTGSAGYITSSGSITGSAGTFTSTTQNSQFNSIGVGTAASATAGEIRATNNITAYYSDIRLKTSITLISNPIDKIKQLSGVSYKSNDVAAKYGYTDQSWQVGVLAQEVKKVLPEAVKLAPFDTEYVDGKEVSISGENYMTVQYEKIIPLLIEAIKEQQEKIEKLESKIDFYQQKIEN